MTAQNSVAQIKSNEALSLLRHKPYVSRPSEPKARVRASSTRYGERRAGTQCKSRSSRSAALRSRLALRLAGTRKASDAVRLAGHLVGTRRSKKTDAAADSFMACASLAASPG